MYMYCISITVCKLLLAVGMCTCIFVHVHFVVKITRARGTVALNNSVGMAFAKRTEDPEFEPQHGRT